MLKGNQEEYDFDISLFNSSKLQKHKRLKNNHSHSASQVQDSEFSSDKIELKNRVTQNDITFRLTNLKSFTEILLSSY